jgi:DNA (cytosine-5)-methyltransferase 1
MREINLLDLFSGIGGFHLGLERAGFKVNAYNSEIDKYAIDVYKHNFKNATYVGSVTDVRAEQLPRIDAITFGSPCQDFSLAGKRKGMGGARSSLITEAIRLINECRPSFFIWENVKGTFSSNNGADFWAIIQAFANIGDYRLEWQLLNTKWFLPQNRERIYLVGYIGDGGGGQIFPIGSNDSKIDAPVDRANTCTIIARYKASTSQGSYINELYKVSSATKKGYEIAQEGDSINLSVPTSKTRRGRVGKGQAQTLDTHCNLRL